ncbi:FkbM family methyltransferase [Methyloceanibacter caenitepidi]|uniref:Uncharacterized protein n=1 Tax=Methyloceanibacter caenitepidi TaxID=1384459 RepID=A0A0A8JZD8_9HYPH|nr:FkbM family methyltransferase [Methyloceanibacter caenitepidi]BAQ15707.1 hypothetical protein GL4_0237 [Methyloceanibacter caenitepidi]
MNDAYSDDDLRELEYREIVSSLPTRTEIFLPTDKFTLDQRLAGIRKVQDIYTKRLDAIYRPKLRDLRKKYKGTKRCFVIGNGPSLNETDLSVLKDEVTFAVNGFFLKAKDLDWRPTFYVVEDHLVAEDRRRWINAFEGSTKLFPAYLGYCLDEGQDTIFFNHLPRKSFPHGYDFSTDAAQATYTGCTVTFTCMQLAFYFGFEEIYLIGVDASYDLPQDVKQADSYAVGVLDMKSDDPNHFHPDYFGKGFRWHDPQVEKMVQAYQEARRVTERTDQRIYNATIGGKLEVFERRAYADIFPDARAPEVVAAANKKALAERVVTPRLLVLDITAQGDGSATGELKRNIFAQWPDDNYLQIFNKGGDALGVQRGLVADQAHDYPADADELERVVDEFDPELILYRPVPDAPALHEFAMHAIASRPSVPLVTWIMDDWPARLEVDDPSQYTARNEDWLWLLENSALRLSICEKMSDAFKERYGYEFQPFANGIEPKDWSSLEYPPDSELVVRYAGALADNMGAGSVMRVAQAIESLAEEGLPIRFEIRTREIWKIRRGSQYQDLKRTSIVTDLLSPEDYRKWLSSAGAVLIAYNFDDDSLRYVGLSMANKLPECLASAAPLIVHGPKAAATVSFVADLDCALVLDKPDPDSVKAGLRELLDKDRRRKLGARGREVAFEKLNLEEIRTRFMDAMSAAAKSGASSAPSTRALVYPRSLKMGVDETKVVAELLSKKRGESNVMFDVGAHVGTSAAFFDALGWSLYCFEPNDENRARLTARFGENPRIRIDKRAVGEAVEKDQAFFVSEESTGIGTLHAFRDTHEEACTVDVTTVGEVARQHGVEKIDFLKIDVEGLDFAVLKGVPWDTIKPEVIECEFEDAKTVPLGHTYTDMADFLVDKGYTVYISEWHPIIRYGIAHDWCRLTKYPSALATPQGWGNLLAFREDPGLDSLAAAFRNNLVSRDVARRDAARRSAAARRRTSILAAQKGHAADRYAHFAESIKGRSHLLYHAGRFVARSARTVWRRRFGLGGAAILAIVIPLVAALLVPSATFAWILVGLSALAVAALAAALILLAMLGLLRQRTADAEGRHRAVLGRIEAANRRTGELDAKLDRIIRSNEALSLQHATELELLRERAVAAERQLGALRYPEAPPCIVFFGHHKCASRFFRFQLMSRVAEMSGAGVLKYEIENPPFHYSQMDELDLANIDFSSLSSSERNVVLFANATLRSLEKIRSVAPDWKGVRVVRDPRQILVSNYFHHRAGHPTEGAGWVWDKLATDQPILQKLSEEDGLLYELDNISKEVIEEQILAPFTDDRLLQFRLEDYVLDPRKYLSEIGEWLCVSDIAGIDLSPVYVNSESGAWQNHFTPRVREIFKERYGQGLINLGYEKTFDW